MPFISRYRKEVTEGLDDTQLRNLEERLVYLRELEERRDTVLKIIAEQDKLSPDLDVSFRGAVSIARRLQDPLAELVKIEPKSIGVGHRHVPGFCEADRKILGGGRSLAYSNSPFGGLNGVWTE